MLSLSISPSPSLSRNDELVKLKGADITWDQVSDTGKRFFTITLTFRKTNQSDGNKGNRLSDFLLSWNTVAVGVDLLTFDLILPVFVLVVSL